MLHVNANYATIARYGDNVEFTSNILGFATNYNCMLKNKCQWRTLYFLCKHPNRYLLYIRVIMWITPRVFKVIKTSRQSSSCVREVIVVGGTNTNTINSEVKQLYIQF